MRPGSPRIVTSPTIALELIAVTEPVTMEFIRRVVEIAEPLALRTALYQSTHDPELLELEEVIEPLEKGDL